MMSISPTLKKWAMQFIDKGLEYLESKGFLADAKKKIPYFERAKSIIVKSQNPKSIEKIDEEVREAYEKWADEVNKQGDSHYKEKIYRRAVELFQQSVWLAEISGNVRKIKNYTRELEKALRKMKRENA